MNTKGLLINFEGLDYSFKETNTKKLYEYIKNNVTDKVKLLSFPNYKSESARLVKRYLNNEFGDASKLDTYIASMFYLIDRLETINDLKIKELLNDGWIVILDRYVNSNIIFQSAKIDSEDEQDKYIEYIMDLEYNKCKLPKPDITIYMNMPLTISKDLIIKRAHKTNTKKDGHEDNFKFLERVHKSAFRLCEKFKWDIVNCADIDNMIIRHDYEIFDDILKIISKNEFFNVIK